MEARAPSSSMEAHTYVAGSRWLYVFLCPVSEDMTDTVYSMVYSPIMVQSIRLNGIFEAGR